MSLLDYLRSSREKRESLPTELTLPVRARSFEPRPYQVQGIEFLRSTKRGILADAPGLGKTFQACEAATLPAVVTCPLSLVEQWADFIRDQYPNEPVSVAAYGDAIRRDTAITEYAKHGGWLVINHDAFRTYFIPSSATLIADEYHHFRNREARRSIGLKQFAKRCDNVFGLTATPVYKDVGDLWHLLHVLDPREWGSYMAFLQRYAVLSNYGFGTSIVRTRNQAGLERAIAPRVLGRTYRQVHMYLPRRIDEHITLKMDDNARKRYNQLRDYYRLELEQEDENGDTFKRFQNAGAVLHALRQLTVTPDKINAIKRIIEDTPEDEPIMIFCWYRETAALLAKRLNAAEITGALAASERRDVAYGMTGQRIRVATMESLSEGIDLSDFHTVVFAECSYVPGQMYQALSRVQRHRTMDSEDHAPVLCYYVRHISTVDEVVYNTQKTRTTGNALSVLREALEMGDGGA